MSTSKEFHDKLMEKIFPLGATSRAMMGEYVVYYKDKVIGGIYDDRFLVKNIISAQKILKDAPQKLPYTGAKLMLLVSNETKSEMLLKLFSAMYDELPTPKPKKRKA